MLLNDLLGSPKEKLFAGSVVKFLPRLFENNRVWAERIKLEDPQYFERLSRTQTPEYLWIGCADSRGPANEIVGLGPGELFVHRNIANLAPPLDANVQSVLQYAVEALKVKHIIVCGHYGCGGVLAALRDWSGLPLENWLVHVRAVYREHKEELDNAPNEEARWGRLLWPRCTRFARPKSSSQHGGKIGPWSFMVGSTICAKDFCTTWI
jgi:carbonic anhydrase